MVVVESGEDRTRDLIEASTHILNSDGVLPRLASLKARSPSCGSGATWIDGAVQQGDGVFAAAVRRAGIPILTEEEDLDSVLGRAFSEEVLS